MTVHLQQQRYSAVIGSEGQIFLRGVLDESSDLKQTVELIKERHAIAPADPIQLDFSHLVSGSWNGFLALDKLLAELKLTYVLRHVTFDLFRYVALLPTLRKAQLGEIELVVVAEDRKVHIKGTESVSVTPSGRFASVGGQQIVGRHSFIFGDRLACPRSAHERTEFDMWYDYISFAAITLALSEDLARSIAMSVIRLASELAAEYKAQSLAMGILQNVEQSVWAREAEDEAKILAGRARDSESVYGQIILGIKKNVLLAESIQKALHAAEGQPRAVLLNAVQNVRTIRQELQNIVQQIENGGTETFALLISVPGKKRFDEAYHKINAVSPDMLTALRETMDILDPLTEDDWNATRDAIFERTKDVEQLVSNLIVLTQGFDLLRQIIEHLINEIEVIEAYLDKGAPDSEWTSFRKDLHERIRRKLVTDQEKLSVDASIPDVMNDHGEEARKPGEVLLF
ncbi:MAG TPA: hypothetical protein VFO10_26140 [Oligoflexus sp.]|uniref:hypothetical protein n=1 Tax=Oligoflexus sp. TaxID=1971216 RepID=UPI002D7E39E2|nr:hypothetical protein [Oligoflexus sp.]HET9240772.1 hypothetical protein [Oligoflexus sp.]